MCNQKQANEILAEVYHLCNGLFVDGIEKAYLYGSYARGDYHAESDVDILLTVNMEATSIAKLRNMISSITSELSLKHDVTVSVTVKPQEQFAKYCNVLPYYMNVVKEGIQYAV